MLHPDLQNLRRTFEAEGIDAAPVQLDALGRYTELLLDWNAKVNLISRKDERDTIRNHVLHSLTLLPALQKYAAQNVLDIGTGGGLPGIPLAIMLPDVGFVLADSIGKKIAAVEDMIEQLGLSNASAVKARVGEGNTPLSRKTGQFDTAVTRAVSKLHDMVRWVLPLMETGGELRLLALKGGDVSQEISRTLTLPSVLGAEALAIPFTSEPYFMEQEKCIIDVHIQR